MLAQITAEERFCAGIVLDEDRVTDAAPIVRYMMGWARDRVRTYCAKKRWSVRVIHSGRK